MGKTLVAVAAHADDAEPFKSAGVRAASRPCGV